MIIDDFESTSVNLGCKHWAASSFNANAHAAPNYLLSNLSRNVATVTTNIEPLSLVSTLSVIRFGENSDNVFIPIV